MEYIEPVVGAAAALLATKTFDVAAQDAADRLWARLKGMTSSLRQRTEGNPASQALLDRCGAGAAQPGDVEQLATLLQALVDEAPEVRADVDDVVRDDAVTTFNVSGSAVVGKIVNIGHARDVTF